MRSNFLNTTFTVVICAVLFSAVSAAENKQSATGQNIEKFKAHKEIEKLQKENFRKINLIEIISKNFGYSYNDKFKRDYWTARILVSKKQIIQAKDLLEKNKRELDDALRMISDDYQKATQAMIDDCIDKLNKYEFSSESNKDDLGKDVETKRKIAVLRNKVKIAVNQFESANEASVYRGYVFAITLYRSSKSYAINILSDLANPEEKNIITEKYKIHIVDNRNEVFNKG